MCGSHAVAISSDRNVVLEDDEDLLFKTNFERAHIFKNVKSYKGKKFVKEAYAAGCDVIVNSHFSIETKEQVAKKLNDFLEKLKIFVCIQE